MGHHPRAGRLCGLMYVSDGRVVVAQSRHSCGTVAAQLRHSCGLYFTVLRAHVQRPKRGVVYAHILRLRVVSLSLCKTPLKPSRNCAATEPQLCRNCATTVPRLGDHCCSRILCLLYAYPGMLQYAYSHTPPFSRVLYAVTVYLSTQSPWYWVIIASLQHGMPTSCARSHLRGSSLQAVGRTNTTQKMRPASHGRISGNHACISVTSHSCCLPLTSLAGRLMDKTLHHHRWQWGAPSLTPRT